MLQSLHIENYALIKQLDLNFDKGFSVITGETGAGKSIMLGALGLLLGQRADLKTIKEGESKCIIEASFAIHEYNLQHYFSENDVDYEDTTIIRREILTSGKSRMFVNDTPVSMQFLKEMGEKLIDIHSQHENLLLKNTHFQLDIIDTIANHKHALETYTTLFQAYKKAMTAYTTLCSTAEHEKENYNYTLFQYEQLCSANLQANEKNALEEELPLLTHAEELKISLSRASELLQEDETGIVSKLKSTSQTIQSIAAFYPPSEDLHQRLQSCFIEIKDIATDISKLESTIEYEPERVQYVSDRLDTIYSLLQKHKVGELEELLDLQASYKSQLDKIQSFDMEIDILKKECTALYESVRAQALILSDTRKKAANNVENTMTQQLSILGMPYVQFQIAFTTLDTPQVSGIDEVAFLFSANKNTTPKPVSDIASGGEIARVMLCLKSLIANSTTLPTIIFDEIDTGVSGEIADKMGNIMHDMSQEMQVVCITHLPQIAAKGTQHFKVYKIENETSETRVKQLSMTERREEIAKMLSGTNISEAALQNAEELLKQSSKG
ncbi:MAG: DNA repair protein RecN [Paludibacteraceae bacterium]|nr:DNA repair protein RecN [Paludibacteraceae bacterium]MBP6285029.1 DNA repair protein RecN [Paludibacteraceae bacterium]